jgi:hypothetical protein
MAGNEKYHNTNNKRGIGNKKEKIQKKIVAKMGEKISSSMCERRVCLKFLQLHTPETRTENMRAKVPVKKENEENMQERWDYYISNTEDDVHGHQEREHKMMNYREQKKKKLY